MKRIKRGRYHVNFAVKHTNPKQPLSYHTLKEHGPKLDYNCTFCTKVFSLKHSLDVHVRSVHSNLAIACDLCKATFSRQSNLTSHYKYVYDQLENIFIMEDGREIEYFECEECSFETRHKKHLRRHASTVHGTKKDFQCTECDYKCNRMENLARHIKTNTKKTPRQRIHVISVISRANMRII